MDPPKHHFLTPFDTKSRSRDTKPGILSIETRRRFLPIITELFYCFRLLHSSRLRCLRWWRYRRGWHWPRCCRCRCCRRCCPADVRRATGRRAQRTNREIVPFHSPANAHAGARLGGKEHSGPNREIVSIRVAEPGCRAGLSGPAAEPGCRAEWTEHMLSLRFCCC